MKKTIQILSILLLLISSKSYSQTNTKFSKKWSLETELIQPFLPTANIIKSESTLNIGPCGGKSDTIIQGGLILGINL